jgi:hypothetical protein
VTSSSSLSFSPTFAPGNSRLSALFQTNDLELDSVGKSVSLNTVDFVALKNRKDSEDSRKMEDVTIIQ